MSLGDMGAEIAKYFTPKTSATENKNHSITQEERDRVLDKIKRSGYDSLTENEKNILWKK